MDHRGNQQAVPARAPANTPLSDRAAILCDLDGCLVSGEQVLPGARELVERCGDRLWIVSNNSTDTPATIAARLAPLGLSLSPARWFLAGAEAVRTVAAEGAGRCAILGDAPVAALGRDLGLTLCQDEPETVILCRDTGFDYERLSALVGWLQLGARMVVANSDLSHPGRDGTPVPETGALLAAVLAVLPSQRYRVFGKPQPTLFERALAKAGVAGRDAIMIGDNPSTDAAGAQALGIPFVAVAPNGGVAHLLGGSQEAASW